MVSGYCLNLWLARYLGPRNYGDYGFVITFMTLVNLAQTSGLPQALSKKIAEAHADVGLIVRAALLLQLLSAVLLTGVIVTLAYPITSLIHDRRLASLVMLSAVILPTYGLYSLLLGYYNGTHAFSRQSVLNISYSLAKFASVIGLTVKFGLAGAIIGFAIAPFLALLVNLSRIPKPQSRDYRPIARELLRISLPLISFAVTTTALLSIDLFVVKKDFPGSPKAGYYVAAQNIALVPYLGLSAFAQMILPVVSKATSAGNAELANRALAKSLKLLLFMLVPTVVCLSALSQVVVRLLFSARYDQAARPLEILAFSYGTLAVFQLIANALNGAGRYKDTVRSSLLGLICMTVFCTLLTPRLGLTGAALGSLAGSIGAILYILLITRKQILPKLHIRVGAGLLFMAAALYVATKLLAQYGYVAQVLLYLEVLLGYLYVGTDIPSKRMSLKQVRSAKPKEQSLVMQHNRLLKARRTVVPLVVPLILLSYLAFRNTIPFTFTKAYATTPGTNPIKLVPASRVVSSPGFYTEYQSPIYFSTKTSITYDRVQATVQFKQSSPNQEILLGYRDQASWHYQTQVLDAPFIDSLGWHRVGSGPYLYEKDGAFKSVSDFLRTTPKTSSIGVYDLANQHLFQPNAVLQGYTPSSKDTTMSTPLRGSFTMYAYVANEPCKMTFTKQDLNWQSGPDQTTIDIYKDGADVLSGSIGDDGDQAGDREPGKPQSITLKNPGPGLPEPGVYKIVVRENDDSVISGITTNLHKLVFSGPLYPAANDATYPIVATTKQTTLYTDANQVTLSAYHALPRPVVFDSQPMILSNPGNVYTSPKASSIGLSSLVLPTSDAKVNGAGYFAFSQDEFFEPMPYKLLDLDSTSDGSLVDYIVTDYPGPPLRQGNWLVASRTFQPRDAYIQHGQISWIINAPYLGERGSTVAYGTISLIATKQGWIP